MNITNGVFKTVTLQFKGTDTINELYSITLDNLNKQLSVLDNENMLKEMRLKLLEQLATVENRQKVLYLAKQDIDYEEFIKRNRSSL